MPLLQEPEERPRHLPGKRFFSVSVMCTIFVLCLFLLIGLEIRHNKLGREVSKLTAQRTALLEENRILKAEMSRLTVFDDLEYVAQSLGLVSPSSSQIIVVP
jgi:hypothetical protein